MQQSLCPQVWPQDALPNIRPCSNAHPWQRKHSCCLPTDMHFGAGNSSGLPEHIEMEYLCRTAYCTSTWWLDQCNEANSHKFSATPDMWQDSQHMQSKTSFDICLHRKHTV